MIGLPACQWQSDEARAGHPAPGGHGRTAGVPAAASRRQDLAGGTEDMQIIGATWQ